jgi:hypothetical protein
MTGDKLVTGLKMNLSPEKPALSRLFLGRVTGDRFFYKHVREVREEEKTRKSPPQELSPVTPTPWNAAGRYCKAVTGARFNLSPNLSPASEVTPCP